MRGGRGVCCVCTRLRQVLYRERDGKKKNRKVESKALTLVEVLCFELVLVDVF